MISKLLYYLPDENKYKVIFMKRQMKEILASKGIMLQRLGKEGSTLGDEKMTGEFEKHINNIENWLSTQSHINVLYRIISQIQ